jgi:hypothetical protein
MGAIRKTMSIATVGLVNWRSKGELLRIEQAAHEATSEKLNRRSRRLERSCRPASIAGRQPSLRHRVGPRRCGSSASRACGRGGGGAST